MPELPEVETTRRGLAPVLAGQRIRTALVRQPALRVPVPRSLPRLLAGLTIGGVARRGKYLLIDCGAGTLIMHLGMSGRIWIVEASTPATAHDHFDLVLASGTRVRLRDPRRFGLVVWTRGDPLQHPLLRDIGPEPLSRAFNADRIYRATRGRGAAVKHVLMDSRVVAGIGNIYANEALFRAGIDPGTPARRIGRSRYAALVGKLKETLRLAIGARGSSLRDYVGSDGRAGYSQHLFMVYDRAGEPCYRCGGPIKAMRQGQRSTFYCPRCQK